MNDPEEPVFLDDDDELIDPTTALCVLREHAPIDFGVDFERALERLQAEAGSRYRAYASSKGRFTPEKVEGLHRAYLDATDRAKALRHDDAEGIEAILSTRPTVSHRDDA